MLQSVRTAWHHFRQNLREVKADLAGQAISRAVLIKQARDIDGVASRLNGANGVVVHGRPPRPISGAIVRLHGYPMQFWTDGSLRHALGHKPGKAARKAMKRARRTP